MVINTNVMALNTHRNLKTVGSSMEKANNRLSSGYRINSAADDAAGLAISEKMRAQIRGLDQASRNAQDGISLIQTAEGALEEISNMLVRMRELAVQAANDTNETEDREKIQLEIDQLKEEIDSMRDRVEFNSMKLLDGSLGGGGELTAIHETIIKYMAGSWINDSLNQITALTGLELTSNMTLNVVFKDLGSNSGLMILRNGTEMTMTLNPKYFGEAAFGADGPAIWNGMNLDQLIAHELTHALMYHNAVQGSTIPDWFNEGLATAIEGGSNTRFAGMSESELERLIRNFTPTTSGSASYTSGYIAVMYLDHKYSAGGTGGGIETLMDLMKSASQGGQSLSFEDAVRALTAPYNSGTGLSMQDVINEMKADLGSSTDVYDFLNQYCNIDLSDTANYNTLKGGTVADPIPNGGSMAGSYKSGETIMTASGFGITMKWPDSLYGKGLYLQVGANSNQGLEVDLGGDISSTSLGINYISVLDVPSASDALGLLDAAISDVSSRRSRLGAYQNRLEYTMNSLDISSENLSSAESRIRDTDMAKEMMRLTKANVLQQAAVSILSQVNQQPQMLLQLL